MNGREYRDWVDRARKLGEGIPGSTPLVGAAYVLARAILHVMEGFLLTSLESEGKWGGSGGEKGPVDQGPQAEEPKGGSRGGENPTEAVLFDDEKPKKTKSRRSRTYSGEFEKDFWRHWVWRGSKYLAAQEWSKLTPAERELARRDLVDKERGVHDARWREEGGKWVPAAERYLKRKLWEERWDEKPTTNGTPVKVPVAECRNCKTVWFGDQFGWENMAHYHVCATPGTPDVHRADGRTL